MRLTRFPERKYFIFIIQINLSKFKNRPLLDIQYMTLYVFFVSNIQLNNAAL